MLKLIIAVAVIGFGLGAGVSGIVEAVDDGDPSDDPSQAASQLQLPGAGFSQLSGAEDEHDDSAPRFTIPADANLPGGFEFPDDFEGGVIRGPGGIEILIEPNEDGSFDISPRGFEGTGGFTGGRGGGTFGGGGGGFGGGGGGRFVGGGGGQ